MLGLYVWPLSHYILYLTNWNVMAVTYSVWLTFSIVNDKDKQNDIQMLGRHHFFYTLAIILSTVAASVYWIIIHKDNVFENFPQEVQ